MQTTERRVRVRSYAKVNLDLRVLFRRTDGYHEIRSLFHTISLADHLELTWTPGGRSARVETECPGLSIPMETNLAHRAALQFLKATKARGSLQIVIRKRIPAGGGLGGGSSNAASVLLTLPALTDRSVTFEDLLSMAASLGSDVPFFLTGGAAVGLGRGEEIYPVPDFPSLAGVLAAPGIAVSTADAYRDLNRPFQEDRPDASAFAKLVREFSGEFIAPASMASRWNGVGLGRNDFEGPVFRKHRQIAKWKKAFLAAGAMHAMMSGSGSSVFGLWPDSQSARAALTVSGPGVTFPFRLVSRSRYQRDWLRSLHPYAHSQTWPPQSNSTAAASRA